MIKLSRAIRDAAGDGEQIAAAFAAATAADRGRYIVAQAAYREMRGVADLCAAVSSAADAEPLIAAASPQARADMLHVLSADDPLERETRIRAIQRAWLDANPAQLAAVKDYYSVNIATFISQWGVTTDPRRAATGSTLIPLILYPKQIELAEFIVDRYLAGEPGAIVKARGVGASYVACAVLVSVAVLGNKGFQATIGSATEPKIDGNRSNKNTLFYKLREFADNLPECFRAGYTPADSTYMFMSFPQQSAEINGEAGKQIGRGGRASIVVLDEAAHLPDSQAIYESLSATSPCVISLSSVNGSDNFFFELAHNPNIKDFIFGWRDFPPYCVEGWYQAQIDMWGAAVFAQEYGLDWSSSKERIIIPKSHVESATVNVEKMLAMGINITRGKFRMGFDCAAEGKDRNAVAVFQGNTLIWAESWSGKGDDLLGSCARAFKIADRFGIREIEFDADGLGLGIPGHFRALNEKRREARIEPTASTTPAEVYASESREIKGKPFHAGGEVVDPLKWVLGSTAADKTRNEDAFANVRAQGAFNMAYEFAQTHRLMQSTEDTFDPSDCIFLSDAIPEISRIAVELSQPQYKTSSAGLYLVDKKPDGSASPNFFDAILIARSPRKAVMNYMGSLLHAAQEGSHARI
jgi:phage terminase large subunit